MKSAAPSLTRTGTASSVPRKTSSGFRPVASPPPADEAASFLEDFGEETTAVEHVPTHLVAATASRDDDLDAPPFEHDEPPTRATPVDLAAMLSIISANGLGSPLGDPPEVPACVEPERPRPTPLMPPPLPPPPVSPPPVHASVPCLPLLSQHALQAGYEMSVAPPILLVNDAGRLATEPPPPSGGLLRVALVALGTFVVTLLAVAGVVWSLGAPLLRR